MSGGHFTAPIHIGNVPVFGGMMGLPILGNVYIVDSGHTEAADVVDNGTADKPFATIDYAIGRCTADNGDHIFLAPGHAEAITSAITADIAGVTIMGTGNGTNRSTLTSAGAIDLLNVTANNVRISNIRFTHGATNNTALINLVGTHCEIDHCELIQPAAALHGITVTATAASANIHHNRWEVTADGPDEAIDIEGVVANLYVGYNMFNGMTITNGWDDGCIVSASAHTYCLIEYNTIMYPGSGVGGIQFSAAATGIIQFNNIGGGTISQMIDPGSCLCFRNRESDAIDESGWQFPTATTAA